MINGRPRSPLEILMFQVPSRDIRAFVNSSCVMRDLVLSSGATHLMLPLRGALPVAWAMEGESSFEANPTASLHRLELPLGTFFHVDQYNKLKPTSPNKPQKRSIIMDALGAASLHDQSHLAVIDEIQGGGTIIPVISGIMLARKKLGISSKTTLFAAEDTRTALNRKKTGQYRRMVAQGVTDLVTTVIDMPLICTDRDPLLDRLELLKPYDPNDDSLTSRDFNLFRNTEAEKLVRFLGSMSRDTSLAHDPGVVDIIVSTQKSSGDECLSKAPEWFKFVAHRQS